MPQTLDGDNTLEDMDDDDSTSTRPHRAMAPMDAAVASATPAESRANGQREDVVHFVSMLHEADLFSEMDADEAELAASDLASSSGAAMRLDLLQAYYMADGAVLQSERRRSTDRWMLYDADEGLTATGLVHKVSAVVPEVGEMQLLRLGSEYGALVLRSGELVCAVEDQEEETGERSVSVRDIVRAVNVLLDRSGVRTRLVGLAGDGGREAYVGQPSMASALALLDHGYLCVDDEEELMDLCVW